MRLSSMIHHGTPSSSVSTCGPSAAVPSRHAPLEGVRRLQHVVVDRHDRAEQLVGLRLGDERDRRRALLVIGELGEVAATRVFTEPVSRLVEHVRVELDLLARHRLEQARVPAPVDAAGEPLRRLRPASARRRRRPPRATPSATATPGSCNTRRPAPRCRRRRARRGPRAARALASPNDSTTYACFHRRRRRVCRSLRCCSTISFVDERPRLVVHRRYPLERAHTVPQRGWLCSHDDVVARFVQLEVQLDGEAHEPLALEHVAVEVDAADVLGAHLVPAEVERVSRAASRRVACS